MRGMVWLGHRRPANCQHTEGGRPVTMALHYAVYAKYEQEEYVQPLFPFDHIMRCKVYSKTPFIPHCQFQKFPNILTKALMRANY